MRLLAATDFALRALMRLAAEPGRRLSTEVLSRELGLSRDHLHKVVQALAAEGLVATRRGAQGGVGPDPDKQAGVLKLVGSDPQRIVRESSRLLDDPLARAAMTEAKNPFGDGHAAEKIVQAVLNYQEH